MVKNHLLIQETRIQSLDQKDPLEKEMTTHFSIAWEIPRTEEPGRYSLWGCEESDTTELTQAFKHNGGILG